MIDKDLNIYHGFLFEDPKAAELLLAQYSDKLIRLAYLYTKDSSAAEDIVEDTFVKLLVKQKLFEEKAKFKAYLYKIARNKCRDYLRKRSRTVPLEDVEEILHTPSFERIILQREQYKELYENMAKLPPQYSEILYLTYFDGLSVEEISELTKKSTKQIYNLTARAKASLKEMIKEQNNREN